MYEKSERPKTLFIIIATSDLSKARFDEQCNSWSSERIYVINGILAILDGHICYKPENRTTAEAECLNQSEFLLGRVAHQGL